MGLFQLINNQVQIIPDSLAIPEMYQIWQEDKTKTKEKAYKELSYVYYLCDFKSPYANYPDDKREQEVTKDFIRESKWKPSELVKLACKKYLEMQDSQSMRLLKSARGGVDKVIKFFQEKDTNHRDYTKNMEKIGKIIESLDKLEDKVKKEIKSDENIRGGGELKNRER